MTASEYAKRRRSRLKSEGLCQDCGDAPMPQKTICKRCKINRDRQRQGRRNLSKREWNTGLPAKKPVLSVSRESVDRVELMMRLAVRVAA